MQTTLACALRGGSGRAAERPLLERPPPSGRGDVRRVADGKTSPSLGERCPALEQGLEGVSDASDCVSLPGQSADQPERRP